MLQVSPNAYLGLIHISGKTLEIKQAGKYKISKLAQQFNTKQASFTGKYSDYIINKVNTASDYQKKYSYVASTTRGPSEVILQAPSDNVENIVKLLQNIPVKLNWDKVNDVKGYKVSVKTFDEANTLLSKTTTTNNITIDLSKLNATTNAPYFIEVQALNSSIATSSKPFFLLDKQGTVSIINELNVLKNTVDTETAIGNLMLASFYDSNGLTMYAISSYQKAVELAPKVEDYKNIRNIYFNEHQVLFTK